MARLPLSAVRVFEAVGRTRSFARAAHDLGLSPSAVSHAIRKLEDAIGLTLFERSTREVKPTARGRLLLEHVQRGLDDMQRGLALACAEEPPPLRLHSAPSFATQWLMPRLARFVAAHPGVDLRLSASTDYARFDNDDFDLDIVYGEPPDRGHERTPLALEHLTPLCCPALAARIAEPRDLRDHALIQCDVQMGQWKGWFEANGLMPPRHYGLRFDRSAMAIAAAVSGMGVVLESTLLAERELASGALVAPLRARSRDIRYVGHYLVSPRRRTRNEAAEGFRTWLFDELAAGTLSPA